MHNLLFNAQVITVNFNGPSGTHTLSKHTFQSCRVIKLMCSSVSEQI